MRLHQNPAAPRLGLRLRQNVRDSSLDVGVPLQIRTRRLPVGCGVQDERFNRGGSRVATGGLGRGFFSMRMTEATWEESRSVPTTCRARKRTRDVT